MKRHVQKILNKVVYQGHDLSCITFLFLTSEYVTLLKNALSMLSQQPVSNEYKLQFTDTGWKTNLENRFLFLKVSRARLKYIQERNTTVEDWKNSSNLYTFLTICYCILLFYYSILLHSLPKNNLLTLIAMGPTRQIHLHSSQTQIFLDRSLVRQLLMREESH